jgi:hypothetical protein
MTKTRKRKVMIRKSMTKKALGSYSRGPKAPGDELSSGGGILKSI